MLDRICRSKRIALCFAILLLGATLCGFGGFVVLPAAVFSWVINKRGPSAGAEPWLTDIYHRILRTLIWVWVGLLSSAMLFAMANMSETRASFFMAIVAGICVLLASSYFVISLTLCLYGIIKRRSPPNLLGIKTRENNMLKMNDVTKDLEQRGFKILLQSNNGAA